LPPDQMVARAESAAAAARWLLEGAAATFAGADTPPGCLLASSAIAVSPEADDVRCELARIRIGVEEALRDRIAADKAAGLLPADTDAAILAAFVTSVIQGMSTLARDGAPRDKLLKVARLALSTWPAPPSTAGAGHSGSDRDAGSTDGTP
jgi:hypothetical protein